MQVGRVRNNGWLFVKKGWRWANDYRWLATIGALLVGMGTLFRPEAPLILIACWIVLGVVLIAQRETLRWIRTVLGMGLVCAIPLLPWTLRNAITLHDLQSVERRRCGRNRQWITLHDVTHGQRFVRRRLSGGGRLSGFWSRESC